MSWDKITRQKNLRVALNDMKTIFDKIHELEGLISDVSSRLTVINDHASQTGVILSILRNQEDDNGND